MSVTTQCGNSYCATLIAEDDAITCSDHGAWCSEECRENDRACDRSCYVDSDAAHDRMRDER